MTSTHLTAILEARAPFTLTRSLCFLDGFTPAAGEQRVSASSLDKVHAIGGRAIACRVATTDQPTRLAVTLRSDRPIDDVTRQAALTRLRFQLSLDDDLAPFYALAENDRAFAPVVAAQRGHHHVKFPSPFEIACWAILGQRTPMRMARKIKDAIVARFGPAITLAGVVSHAFPEAAQLVAASEEELAAVVSDRRKAAAIAAVARAFDDVDEGFLRTGAFDRVESWLLDLPRIGPWSAAFILFRGLGRMPRLALNEGPIFECARELYGASLATRDIKRIADGYGDYCGYWALYLRSRSIA